MSAWAPEAIIDLSALKNNVAQVKRIAPHSKLMAAVKADAYGHGAIDVCQALHDSVDAFAVARLAEALALREAGITTRIVLLEGVFDAQELDAVAQHHLDLVVHQDYQLDLLAASSVITPIPVWLKVDTGMHRLGFPFEQLQSTYERLMALPCVEHPPKILSHFACADQQQHPLTEEQWQMFDAIHYEAVEKSLANSAGVFSVEQSHYDWVRPGIALYGASPKEGRPPQDFDLQPVMHFQSKLIAVRPHKKNEPVGYGATWTSPTDTTLGIVAVGYGDGYPRHAKTGTPVFVNGRKVPLVGRVSMDMITVDLGADAKDLVGDSVELWGNHILIDEVAQHSDTISYELTSKLTRRVQKKFI